MPSSALPLKRYLLSVLVLLVVGLPDGVALAAGEPGVTFDPYKHVIWIPTRIAGGPILNFAFDSAATTSAIEWDRAEELKIPFAGLGEQYAGSGDNKVRGFVARPIRNPSLWFLLRPSGSELAFNRELDSGHFAGNLVGRFLGAFVNHCHRTARGLALIGPSDALSVHFPADLDRLPVGRAAGSSQVTIFLGKCAVLLAFIPSGAALNLPFPGKGGVVSGGHNDGRGCQQESDKRNLHEVLLYFKHMALSTIDGIISTPGAIVNNICQYCARGARHGSVAITS
jgi:hypothetical protein